MSFWDEDGSFWDEEEVEEVEDKPEIEGFCTKCFNTGFLLETRGNNLGIIFTASEQDSTGKPIRKLSVCGHDLNLNY